MGWLPPGYGWEKCHFVTVRNRPIEAGVLLVDRDQHFFVGGFTADGLPDIASGRDTVGLDDHGGVANALTQTGEESDVNGHGSRINSQADTTVYGSIIGAEIAGHKQR